MTAMDRPQVAAQLLAMAESMGITLDELTAASTSSRPEGSTTVSDFLPAVEAATTDGAKLTYRPYWRLLVARLGDDGAHRNSPESLNESPHPGTRWTGLFGQMLRDVTSPLQ